MISRMTTKAYRAMDALSASALKHFMRSPAHYMENRLNPKPPTPAMEFGTLVHTAVLEPELCEQLYYCLDDSDIYNELRAKGFEVPRLTKEYKAWKKDKFAESQGKIEVKIEDWNAAVHIRKAIQAHPKASALLAMGGKVEHVMQWTHPTGVLMKGRPDLFIHDYHADYGLIVDLKTTDNASPHSFTRTIANHSYHIQAGMYCEGVEIITGKPCRFAWLVVEREAPHVVMLYHARGDDIALAKHIIYGEARKFKQCLESGIWHGYDEPENDEIEVPAWAYPE